MLIEAPEASPGDGRSPEDLRLDLACALYAKGSLGKVRAAEFAGVDFFTLQRALGERHVPMYTEQRLADDLQSLKELFPG